MKQKNKTKKPLSLTLVALRGEGRCLGVIWFTLKHNVSPSDKCTDEDREIGNCVPAGKCGSTSEIDARIECDVKNYDRKFHIDACTSKDWEINNCVAADQYDPHDERLLLPLFSPFIDEGEIASLSAYNFFAWLSSVQAQESMSGQILLIDISGDE